MAFSKHVFACLACFTLTTAATAQQALPPPLPGTQGGTQGGIALQPQQPGGTNLNGFQPAGQWRCIVNSPIVSIDLLLNAQPGNVTTQGSLIYVQTNKVYDITGQASWTWGPADDGQGLFTRIQVYPAKDHATFSVFARYMGDPNHLWNTWQNPQTGQTVDTRCQRIG
ncbi:hypothetical protein N4R57_08905 [Rhodobacteraceae bacterium D3-12]|nr:hypothetical protein N4R57_08905 [Rhodobacteraceae bacterium D3-12]